MWEGLEEAIKPYRDIVYFLSLFSIVRDGDNDAAADYSF
jgi:hypothetical protein